MFTFEDVDLRSARIEARRPVGLRGYDAKYLSMVTAKDTGPDTIVQQHFSEDADINTIVRRYGITGQLPLGPGGPMYGDFSGITDYESARATMARADEAFMQLPPDVRLKFKNDPAELIRFAQSVSEDEFVSALAPVPVEPVAATPVPPVTP